MRSIKPLKRFGQNYLTDPNILRKIAAEISPEPDDNLVEIGPGTGALTSLLYEKNKNLWAIEIDSRVTEELRMRFPRLTVLQQDFLDTSLSEIYNRSGKKIRVAGNIPYNITSPIIFKLIYESKYVSDAVLMVQHEVALRMKAAPGVKDYGILAVLLGYFAEVKYCFKVSPHVFYPPPKVSSAVVHIFMKKEYEKGMDDTFIRIVKASFGKRRKTLKNSLGNSIFADLDFTGSGIDLTKRAEQLSTAEFLRLADFAHKIPG